MRQWAYAIQNLDKRLAGGANARKQRTREGSGARVISYNTSTGSAIVEQYHPWFSGAALLFYI